MIGLFKFFIKQQDLYLDPSFEFDVRLTPSTLLKELNPEKNSQDYKKFIIRMKKPTKSPTKLIRRLTVLHLLIMNSQRFYELVEKLLPLRHNINDDWLVQNVINPYTNFLKRCCMSQQMYMKGKVGSNNETNFQILFYIINLFTELFKVVRKMPMLGRYYKDSNDVVTSTFVNLIAVQAQRLYNRFKNIIMTMIDDNQKYIPNRQAEIMMKSVIGQSMVEINQEMKKLFLDKYFYPYGKGINLRLFRLEDQTEYSQKIIQGILTDHKNTERMNQQMQLHDNLFPSEGQFNKKFYEESLVNVIENEGVKFEESVADVNMLVKPHFGFKDWMDKETGTRLNEESIVECDENFDDIGNDEFI